MTNGSMLYSENGTQLINYPYHDKVYNLTQNATSVATEWNNRNIFTYSSHAPAVNIVLSIIFILIIIWTIVGNLTVIISVKTSAALRASPSNILVTNLALSDLLLGLLVLPFSSIVEVCGFWPLGKELCYMWLLVDVLLCTASIWSLLIIAVDRYTATFYPIWYRTKHQTRRLITYITIVWVVSASTSLPPLFVKSMLKDSYHPNTIPPNCQLFDTIDFVLYSSVMTFILPAVVLFILYGRIFFELKRRAIKLNEMKHEYRQSLQKDGIAENHVIHQQLQELEEENSSSNSASGSNTDSNLQDTSMSHENIHKHNGVPKQECEKALLVRDDGSSDTPNNTPSKTPTKKKAHQSPTNLHGNGSNFSVIKRATTKHRKDRREERATRIMLTIMLFFIVCWLPFFIMYITRSALSESCPHCIPEQVKGFLIWLGYMNSAINPVLYAAFNKQFRVAFRAVWCGRLEDLKRQRTRTMINRSSKSKSTLSNGKNKSSTKTLKVTLSNTN